MGGIKAVLIDSAALEESASSEKLLSRLAYSNLHVVSIHASDPRMLHTIEFDRVICNVHLGFRVLGFDGRCRFLTFILVICCSFVAVLAFCEWAGILGNGNILTHFEVPTPYVTIGHIVCAILTRTHVTLCAKSDLLTLVIRYKIYVVVFLS